MPLELPFVLQGNQEIASAVRQQRTLLCLFDQLVGANEK